MNHIDRYLILTISILLSFLSIKSNAASPNQTLLPEEYTIYYQKELGMTDKAFKGSLSEVIPTSNHFEGEPGCYLSCYTQNPVDGVYSIGDHIYLTGQIRVQGRYYNALCIPHGYENKDARTADVFKALCEREFPMRCQNQSCWVGGETSHWFKG